jgi:chromosome segregation ATPase
VEAVKALKEELDEQQNRLVEKDREIVALKSRLSSLDDFRKENDDLLNRLMTLEEMVSNLLQQQKGGVR